MRETVLNLLEEKKYSKLRSMLSELNPADIAQIIGDEEFEQSITVVYRLLPKELAAEVFVELDSDMQQLLIEAFTDLEIKRVFDELYFDDAVDIIDEMPASVAKRILKQADPEARKIVNQLLAYPDDSAGSLMTTEYIGLKKDMTVAQAFAKIRAVGEDAEDIYTCYVTAQNRELLGFVTVKDLLLSQSEAVIGEIMEQSIIFATTLEDKESVTEKFLKYDLTVLPVVDKENRLVGIVTVDDALDVLQEEATEDIEKMSAILPTEKSYFKTGVFSIFKSRIPWLMFLMLSATFTGAIISGFEGRLTAFPALIAFIPMLMGTAGNCGSQSSVTIIRGISLGDVEFKDLFKVLWKEIRVALICAASLAAVNFVKLWLVDNLWLNAFDAGQQLLEMAVVCLTLMLTVMVAKIVGGLMPILAKKIGLDPAVMASPLITTAVDAITLVIYFAVATALL